MTTLLICLCKDDPSVISAAKDFYKAETCAKYFGSRIAGIQGQLNMLRDRVDEIIVTAHGSDDEIGNENPGLVDVSAEAFATILNKAAFAGDVYFDVCEGNEFGKNVKKSLSTGARLFGAVGSTGMQIDRSKCVAC
jgi:hypothetical protein